MNKITVTIDARPAVWGDAVEFLNAPEQGSVPRSKILAGKQYDAEELIPEVRRADMQHRDWRHIQSHTSPGKVYEVHWVHGQFVDSSHAGKQKRHAHFESWFLVVDDSGHFLDVPASLCTPISSQ